MSRTHRLKIKAVSPALCEKNLMSAKLLIIDDEKPVAEALSLFFQFEGYEVRTANSAEEGIAILPDWRPDLAIVDVFLPKMSGIDLAIHLRNTNPSIAVMLVSGEVATRARSDRPASEGPFEIAGKPITVPQIQGSVERMLA
jgi:CheY-like chemotaxis protein